jgi:S1-C subfamily serine protease
MTLRSALAATLAALALGLAACGGGNDDNGGNAAAATASPTSGDAAVELQAAYNRVVKNVSPSVVQIETGKSLGSGIVFDDQRDVVTNAHVVGDAERFRVTLSSGKRVEARLVGRWEPGDLAVVQAQSGDLKPAKFADSSELSVGDIVLAMGNPLGLRSSVTQGIISSLGRTVSEPGGATLPSAIQTSAAINPGNSGGALVNLAGEVVGIPTLAAIDQELGGSAAPGIGFAIPSSTVTSIARQLIENGQVTESGRAALGVRVATVTGGGVVVVLVEEGGAAEKAGLERGDIIVALAGKQTPTVGSLTSVLAGLKPGQEVQITVRSSDGTEQDREITLGQLGG